MNVTIYGVKLELVSNCSLYVGNENNIIYEVKAHDLDLVSNSIKCFIPKSVQNQSPIKITLRNEKGERNQISKEISFYSKKSIQLIIFRSSIVKIFDSRIWGIFWRFPNFYFW
jgi:hypothetical protein